MLEMSHVNTFTLQSLNSYLFGFTIQVNVLAEIESAGAYDDEERDYRRKLIRKYCTMHSF